ncbi:MAG: hypothetical protein NTU97_04750, partial [Candidatus Magasanikbacteria bacterium]|nr:hypothetical protein [Candidatus Magasanikbacteria bacterium]
MKKLPKSGLANTAARQSLLNMANFRHHKRKEESNQDKRLGVIRYLALFFLLLVVIKLFFLQVINYDLYAKAAENRHNIFLDLWPNRGQIYFQDLKNPDSPVPAALNKEVYTVVVDPKVVKETKQDVVVLTQVLSKKLDVLEKEVLDKINKENSRYEIIKKKVSVDTVEELKLEKLSGVFFDAEPARYYPEKTLAAQELGYLGYNNQNLPKGFYGVEGYFNELLSGVPGFLSTEKDAHGGW